MEKLRDYNFGKSTAKVSIIIPIYNVELYISQCIESVICQTLKEIEIICINDGSTDNSRHIVEKYAKVDNRIKLINKNNEGLSSARNDGVSIANGDYLFFLDSDDYIEYNTIEILYLEATKADLDVVTFGARAFCDKSNTSMEEQLLQKRTDSMNKWILRNDVKGNTVVTGQEFLSESYQSGHYVSMAWLLFVNKNFYNTNGLNFPVGIIHEDELFTLTTLVLVKRMKFINIPFYNYRIRSDSIMGNLDVFNSTKSVFFIYMECLRFFDFIEIEDKYLNDIFNIVDRFSNVMYDRYKKLSEEDKNRIVSGFGLSERLIFSQIIRCKLNLEKLKKYEKCH